MNIYSKHNLPQGFYVYSYLREDGTPYYVGKGKGIRAWKPHIRSNGTNLLPNDDRIQILAHRLTDNEARLLERRLISIYGRKDLGTGILRNLSDGGDGTSGRIMSTETKDKKSKKLKGVKTGPHSPERIQNMSIGRKGIPAWNKGIPISNEQLSKINYELTCPHCGKTGNNGAMRRWHFSACKSLQP